MPLGVFTVLILICVVRHAHSVCPFDSDLDSNLKVAPLYWSGRMHTYKNTTHDVTLNLCEDPTSVCGSNFMCATEKNGQPNITLADTRVGIQTHLEEILVTFTAKADSSRNCGAGEQNLLHTLIYFTCDKNSLGAPLLLNGDGCTTYFEWKSIIACKGTVADAQPQIPCYIYNATSLYDLGPLTKITDSQIVDNVEDGSNFYINLCRNIFTPSDETCRNSSACLQTGYTFTNWGEVTEDTALKIEGDHILLNYTAVDGKVTELRLYCAAPGDSQPPVQTGNSNNLRKVEWYTRYACKHSEGEIGTTCKLDNIDLTPLKGFYTVTSGDMSYEIAMCGEAIPPARCGSPSDMTLGAIVSCQNTSKDSFVLGRADFTHLRYLDSGVVMSYDKGNACSSGVLRTTIIKFTCDPNIVKGSPEYKSEDDCYYIFEWKTAAACAPSLQSDCSFTDEASHQRFDFSSLTVDSSSSLRQVSTDSGVAYINVCGSVGVQGDCNEDASICHTVGSTTKMWGSSTDYKFEKQDSAFALVYSSSDQCSGNTTFTSTILFTCETDDGGHGSGPAYLPDPSTECDKKFRWYTPLACPTQSSTNCTLQSSGSDFVYDLTSTKGHALSITQAGRSYTLSICDTLPQDECGGTPGASICSGSEIIAQELKSLRETSADHLTAIYKSGVPDKVVEVHFSCDHSAEVPVVRSASTTGDVISFDISTTLTCSPKQLPCGHLKHGDKQFDLSDLIDVAQHAVDSHSMNYYFTVCGHLPSPADCLRLDGATSSCQITTSHEAVNLGYAATSPQISQDSEESYTISIHYVNGKPCGHGNGTPRQTFINMTCSTQDEDPTVTEDDNCNYYITWKTHYACPTSQPEASVNCTVTNDEGIRFDFCDLKGQIKSSTNDEIKLKLFDTFSVADGSACYSATKSSSVCANKEVIGVYQNGKSSLKYQEGDFVLAMSTDDDCPASHRKITTFLTLKCPSSDYPSGTLIYDNYNFTCSFHLRLYTPQACPPISSSPCTYVTDSNIVYDFSGLTLSGSNYNSLGVDVFPGEKYFINVCHEVNRVGEAAGCPPGAGACLKNGSSSISIGQLTHRSPILDLAPKTTNMYLIYENGDNCADDNARKMSTLIFIQCDNTKTTPEDIILTNPQYAGDACRRDFRWVAPCSRSDQTHPTESCDHLAGKVNFNSLQKQYKIESPNHYYYINVPCSHGEPPYPLFTSCNGNATFGVCQVEKQNSDKQVVAGTMIDGGTVPQVDKVLFNFTDGKMCAHDEGQRPRNVELTLYCDPTAPLDSKPVYQGEHDSDCTYIIQWPRRELCPNIHPCVATDDDGNQYDLSALSGRPNKQVDGSDPNSPIYLEVCQSLRFVKENVFCPAGSAVCLEHPSDKYAQSLGSYKESPKYLQTGQVSLTYESSDTCSSGHKVTSHIIFTCQPDSMGSPKLTHVDSKCVYTFEWPTRVVCPSGGSSGGGDAKSCSVKDSATNYDINLTPLKQSPHTAGNYKLSVCRPLNSSEKDGDCPDDAAVCDGAQSFGKASTQQIIMGADDVIIQYDGDNCNDRGAALDDKYQTMIHLSCNKTAGIGKPILTPIPDKPCLARFDWKTSAVCIPDCEYTKDGHTYNFQHLNNHRGQFIVPGDKGDSYTLNVCKGLTELTSCSTAAEGMDVSVCKTAKDGTKTALAYSNTLIIIPHGEDNFTLQQTMYNENVCATTGMHPTVEINVYCKNTAAGPTFIDFNEATCTYRFKWPTDVACHAKTVAQLEVQLSDTGEFTINSDIYSVASLIGKTFNATESSFTYAVSVRGPIASDSLNDAYEPECTDGLTSVCQHADSPSLNRQIGRANNVAYYFADDELRVNYDSDSVCGRFPNINTSVNIHILCNESRSSGQPEFSYESRACRYTFVWATASICHPIGTTNSNHGLSQGATAAIVIICLCLIATAILVIYKWRKRRTGDVLSMGYSSLRTDEDSSLLTSESRRYNDDDEDLLI